TPPEYRSHRLHHDKLPRDFSAGEKPGLERPQKPGSRASLLVVNYMPNLFRIFDIQITSISE
ncbi:MAG: hypothetical protein WBX22_27520, partial [Silvibacterium sp.]